MAQTRHYLEESRGFGVGFAREEMRASPGLKVFTLRRPRELCWSRQKWGLLALRERETMQCL